jgi:transposase InsO family protein
VTIYDESLKTYGAPRVRLELADEHEIHVGRQAGGPADAPPDRGRLPPRQEASSGSSGSATQSRDQARLSIFRYIETFYNPRRRHSSLGGISPDKYDRRFRADYKARRSIHVTIVPADGLRN